MPLICNTLGLPSFAMQNSKQFFAGRPWRYDPGTTLFLHAYWKQHTLRGLIPKRATKRLPYCIFDVRTSRPLQLFALQPETFGTQTRWASAHCCEQGNAAPMPPSSSARVRNTVRSCELRLTSYSAHTTNPTDGSLLCNCHLQPFGQDPKRISAR